MDNEQFFVQRGEIYLVDKGKARHITGDTKPKAMELFRKIADDLRLPTNWEYRHFVDEHEMPPIGQPITKWPENDEPELKEPRRMAVLGTCLPGCESMMKDLGFTHAYGNRMGWPDYNECERLGMKVFVNVRDDNNMPSDEFIRKTVAGYTDDKGKFIPGWKDRPVCGGYWSDSVGGHEPDITNQPPSDIQRYLDQRKRFYDIVRSLDPDVTNHPVMEMFDCTEYDDFAGHPYPGWKLAYSDKTHDLLVVDIYCYAETDEPMKKEITTLFRKLVKPYAHTHQVVPQINAIKYRPGSIWCAYDTWKSLLSSDEFDNPYRSAKVSLAYYKDETVRKDGAMQVEIRAVNKEIMNV